MIPALLAGEAWAFAFCLRQFNLAVACVSAFVVIALCLLVIREYERLVRTAFVLATVVIVGSIAMVSAGLQSQANPRALQSKSFEMVRVDVNLESQLKFGFWKATLLSADGANYSAPVLLADTSKSNLKPGCAVAGLARLIPNDRGDRAWLLKMERGEFRQSCSARSPIENVKANFLAQLRGLNQDARGLVAGLSIGDTSLISQQTSDQMKLLSLTHLTAVSGANCAIVLGIVLILLRKSPLPRLARTLSSIAFLGLYLLLVGPQASVLRAAFMSVVIMVLVTAGRSMTAIGALSWASIGLLVMNPPFACDFGFALSVAATAGILLLTPWLFGLFRKRMPVWLAALLSVSAAAQILCAPILLQLQSGIPTYSLLANALVEPLVAPITVLGIVACLVSAFGFGLLAAPISWLASLPAALVVSVVHNLSGLPLVTLWWPGGPLGTALLALFALGALLLAKTSWRLLAKSIIATCGVTLLFVAGFGFFKSTEWPVKNWQLINCNVGQGDSLLIRSQDHFALVDVGRDAKPVKDCLDRLGVRKLDLLVLTHFDADHVGGLSGALEGRQVVEGMLTDFDDDRPQAQATANQLRAAANQTVRAFAGMNGRLGNVNWLVLQPELHGEGSEDPNDGSITMRWDAPEYTLFTMADLGEKGQMRLVQLHPSWISIDHRRPMLLKVSHHGSADQYPELIESLMPDLAIISVGKANPYGHPTARTLAILHRVGSAILRTDQDGAISVLANSRDGLTVGSGG